MPGWVVTAASVAEALSRYLGEGAPHTLTSLSAPTAFLAPDAPRGAGDPGEDSLGSHDVTFTGDDPEATQAAPAPRWNLTDTDTGSDRPPSRAQDPEATQAAPLARPAADPGPSQAWPVPAGSTSPAPAARADSSRTPTPSTDPRAAGVVAGDGCRSRPRRLG